MASFFRIAKDMLFKQFVKSNKRFPTPAENTKLDELAIAEASAMRKKDQADSGIETLRDLFNKKYPPHNQRNELGFMQKSYPPGVQPGSTMAKAIDESEMFKGFKPEVIEGGMSKKSSTQLRGNETFDELIDPKRIKGGISTQIKLNSPRENKQYAKDLISGKSAEFKQLSDNDRKELLDLIEEQMEKDGSAFDGFAFGGLATMFRKK
jgi:hypothetical protein|tara:strand:- start:155 stop:778 length:624 start_codon:yes stop_codon:yes gene_type:complete